MDQATLKKLKLKPLAEILKRLNEVIHKHRRRYIARHTKPCPRNCKLAHEFAMPVTFQLYNSEFQGKHRGTVCEGCGSHNPDLCKKEESFQPIASKETLMEQFRNDIRDPQTLLRDYRDIAFFLWVVGGFDETVDEAVIANVEPHAKEVAKPVKAPLFPATALGAKPKAKAVKAPQEVNGNK